MIVEIHSNNPELSSILGKNISSFNGTQLRSHKNGVIIGRFISPHEYHLIFQDSKYSYTNVESNQLDFQSYCNPRVFLGIAAENLRHILQSRDTYNKIELPWLNSTMDLIDSNTFETKVIIRGLYIDMAILKYGFVLQKYMSGIDIIQRHGNICDLIVTKNTVFDAVNMATFTLMYIAARSREPWFITKDIAAKYIRIMSNLKPIPYFVLYCFARNVLQSKETFRELVTSLEELYDGDVELQYGGSQLQRISFVKSLLIEDKKIKYSNILELGSGEMDYPHQMFKYLNEGASWYSSDKVDYSHLIRTIQEKNKKSNMYFVDSLLSLDKKSDSVLLAIEVIEHMPMEDSITLLSSIINHHTPSRVVITTPNFSFNKNYDIPGFRHDDHYFELTKTEFINYINDLSVRLNIDYLFEFSGIGDRVDGEFMSFAAILERK